MLGQSKSNYNVFVRFLVTILRNLQSGLLIVFIDYDRLLRELNQSLSELGLDTVQL